MRTGIVAVLLCVIVVTGVLAAGDPMSRRNDQPIKIKSNELFTDNAAGTATFVGKVVARQGDLVIYSDRLIVHYADKDKEVDRVEAFGNVRIVQENRRGEADHAVYERQLAKITLDGGKPKVSQGEDTVTGEVITYFLNDEKSVATGGKTGRVEATIQPKSKGRNVGTKP
ncbi:MAG: lipopolysaccharide transport periplasmic protein LptA [Geobacter sp.]|nr:MAG: lipopolysaccharide transport periplasmic protein LptA [Geobacter sp.]